MTLVLSISHYALSIDAQLDYRKPVTLRSRLGLPYSENRQHGERWRRVVYILRREVYILIYCIICSLALFFFLYWSILRLRSRLQIDTVYHPPPLPLSLQTHCISLLQNDSVSLLYLTQNIDRSILVSFTSRQLTYRRFYSPWSTSVLLIFDLPSLEYFAFSTLPFDIYLIVWSSIIDSIAYTYIFSHKIHANCINNVVSSHKYIVVYYVIVHIYWFVPHDPLPIVHLAILTICVVELWWMWTKWSVRMMSWCLKVQYPMQDSYRWMESTSKLNIAWAKKDAPLLLYLTAHINYEFNQNIITTCNYCYS